jgi:GWxTD domain-containing protein
MKIKLFLYSVIFVLAIITFSGCSSIPKSFKETVINDMYPILSEGQYHALDSLNTDEQINEFIEKYWQNIDSVSGITKNELRAEYLRRLEYANEHFPDHYGWMRSDRKRIYLIYGPPYDIERHEFADIDFGTSSKIKSMEIWSYMTSGKNISHSSYGDDINLGEKKFIFGDITGFGIYKILYSSEDNKDIDLSMFKSR